LQKLKELVGEDPTQELVDSMRDLAKKRQAVQDRMEEERQRIASKPQEALGEAQGLIAEGAKDRERLANAIRGVVKELRCLFIGGRGQDRVAVVDISFHGTTAVRTFWIDYIPERAGRWGNRTPEAFHCHDKLSEKIPASLATPEGVAIAEHAIGLLLRLR